MNVVIHLLDLFYRRSNSNVKEVVPLEAAFFYLVRTKTVFSGLIYAMCACAVQYSTHPMARATMAGGQQSLDETFSKLARVSIHDWAETDRHLDYLRTCCILIDYDAAKCHGKQAWANICKYPDKDPRSLTLRLFVSDIQDLAAALSRPNSTSA
jgi:hypothetical protein